MMSRRNKILISSVSLFLLTIALILFYSYLHNFAAVIPGQVFRSRQLSAKQFERKIQQYHIQSIINLRGTHPKIDWYKGEMKAVNDMQIKHYDFDLKSQVLPDPHVLQQLIVTIDTAPRPLLVHCESGVDRSGLAAEIALLLDNKYSLHDAQKQISYRHFVLAHQSVGKQFFRRYKTWLKQHNLTTSRAVFLGWAGLTSN